MNNTNQGQWLQKLQSFLNDLLKNIIKDQKERNSYLDARAMAIWSAALTHESFSPSDNYEDLEYLGDAALKYIFPKYLMNRFPYLHKNEYTELNVAYMSKVMQGKLSRKLGFTEFIRFTGIDKVILNLDADVFESFFGALDTISSMVTPGLEFANCYNMILYIFNDVDIDVRKGKGAPKTQVIQIFVRFDLPKPIEQIDDRDKYNIIFSVILPKENLEFLRSYGVNIVNPVIGVAKGSTKAEADFEAYTQALNLLESYGITTDWADKAKQSRDFMDPAIAPYVPEADKRLKAEGFERMYFFIPRKTVTPKGAIVQLVGVRPNDRHEVLSYTYTNERENSYRTAKSLVVRQYAGQ